MSKKLFVGGLSWDTTDSSLEEAFAQAGVVESAQVVLGEDGRSRGFGFVTFANDEDASAAVQMWNGKELDGREIRVNEDRPREASGNNANKVYVGNLSWSTTDESLAEAFSQAGTVVSARVIMNREGRSAGFGFVEFSSAEEVKQAIQMWDGKDLDGRTLRVNEDRGPKPAGSRFGGDRGGFGGGGRGGYNNDRGGDRRGGFGGGHRNGGYNNNDDFGGNRW